MCVHAPLRLYCETLTSVGLTDPRNKPAPKSDYEYLTPTPEPADDH